MATQMEGEGVDAVGRRHSAHYWRHFEEKYGRLGIGPSPGAKCDDTREARHYGDEDSTQKIDLENTENITGSTEVSKDSKSNGTRLKVHDSNAEGGFPTKLLSKTDLLGSSIDDKESIRSKFGIEDATGDEEVSSQNYAHSRLPHDKITKSATGRMMQPKDRASSFPESYLDDSAESNCSGISPDSRKTDEKVTPDTSLNSTEDSPNLHEETEKQLTQHLRAKVSRGQPRRFHSDLGFSTVSPTNNTIPTPRTAAVLNNSTLRRHLARIMGVEQASLTVKDFQWDFSLKQTPELSLPRKSKLRATVSDGGLREERQKMAEIRVEETEIGRDKTSKDGAAQDSSDDKENNCSNQVSKNQILDKSSQSDFRKIPFTSALPSLMSPFSGSRTRVAIPSFEEFKRMRHSKTVSPSRMFQTIAECAEPLDKERELNFMPLRKTQSTGHLQRTEENRLALETWPLGGRSSRDSPNEIEVDAEQDSDYVKRENVSDGRLNQGARNRMKASVSFHDVVDTSDFKSAKSAGHALKHYDHRAKSLHRANAMKLHAASAENVRASHDSCSSSDRVDSSLDLSDLNIDVDSPFRDSDNRLKSQYSVSQKYIKQKLKSSRCNQNERKLSSTKKSSSCEELGHSDPNVKQGQGDLDLTKGHDIVEVFSDDVDDAIKSSKLQEPKTECGVHQETFEGKPPRPRYASTPLKGHLKVKEKKINRNPGEPLRAKFENIEDETSCNHLDSDELQKLNRNEHNCIGAESQTPGCHELVRRLSSPKESHITTEHLEGLKEDCNLGNNSDHVISPFRTDESHFHEGGTPNNSSDMLSVQVHDDRTSTLPPQHPLLSGSDKMVVTRSTSDVSDLKAEEVRKKPSKSRRVRAYRSDPFSLNTRKTATAGSKFDETCRSLSYDTATPEDIQMLTKTKATGSSGALSSRSQTSMDSSFEEEEEVEEDYSSELLGEFSRSASKKSFCRGRKRKECGSCSEVERVDSGVGAELRTSHGQEQFCDDCEIETSNLEGGFPLCQRCARRRRERKAAIEELIDTEVSYGNDLSVMKEEFAEPMHKTGLLSPAQCSQIFSNLDELISVNVQFRATLSDALKAALRQGDGEYSGMWIGQLFLESSNMLLAFETYCIRESEAVSLLDHLEREKDLLRVFLAASQSEKCSLRRRDLKSFLMVPIQRVMKYPLLLNRIYKATPHHHGDKQCLKDAQDKVKNILDSINNKAKERGAILSIRRKLPDLWRSGSLNHLDECLLIQKTGIELLGWLKNLVQVVLTGRLMFTQPVDHLWMKKLRNMRFSPACALLASIETNNPKEHAMTKPQDASTSHNSLEAALVLMKEKNGCLVAIRPPIYLKHCIVHMDSDCSDVFELCEMPKESFLLKSDKGTQETLNWLSCIRRYTRQLGKWRKRRGALPNIMFSNFDK